MSQASNTPEFIAADNRIREAIADIEEQMCQIIGIAHDDEISGIIPDSDKNSFIFKLASLVTDYGWRDDYDNRDETIAKLTSDLEKAQKDVRYHRELWLAEYEQHTRLKEAFKAITAAYIK